jgi:hypothetical protein
MAQLTQRQPGTQGGGEGEQDEENEGKDRGHGKRGGGSVPECKL